MLVVGLTGGIGSGKTTVAELFVERGAVVIDADQIAREIVQPGEPALEEIARRFGADVITEDGHLDRQRVADIVFNDPDALHDLNRITHPRIGLRIGEHLAEHLDTDRVVFVDHPLLIENRMASSYPAVVVVMAPEEERVRRLVEHRGLDEDDARARIRNQASDEERREVASHVIDNGGTPEDLPAQVDEVWDALLRLRAELEGSA